MSLKKIHVAFLKFGHMLAKRVSLPPSAMEAVGTFRTSVKAYWDLVVAQLAPEKQVNTKKVSESMCELQKAEIQVPLRMRIFWYTCQAQDFMEMGRFSAVAELLRANPSPLVPCTDQCILETNMNIIEAGLSRLARDCINKV